VSTNELSGREWKRVFSELAELNVFYVNIAGGEPTIHPQFPEIIEHLSEIGLHFILTTNGLCNRRSVRAITQASEYIIGLKVSLDGPTAESHSALRVGPDYMNRDEYFDRTMSCVREFLASGVPLTIATCLHAANIGLVREFRDLILELRPVSWFVSTIAPNGRAKRFFSDIFATDGEYSHEFWQETKAVLQSEGIYVRYIDMPTAAGYEDVVSAFGCPAATSFCEINSDGLVSPCPLSRVNIPKAVLDFPNVRDMSMAQAWNSPAFGTFRSMREQGCSGCSAFDACGRCVAQSIEWFDGDPYQPTPFCIEKGEILQLDNLDELREKVDAKKRLYALTELAGAGEQTGQAARINLRGLDGRVLA